MFLADSESGFRELRRGGGPERKERAGGSQWMMDPHMSMHLRQGVTHSKLTKLMAHEYMRAFSSGADDAGPDGSGTDYAGEDDRARWRAEEASDPAHWADSLAVARGTPTGMPTAARQASLRRRRNVGTLLREVNRDVAFGLDVALMRMKQTDMIDEAGGGSDGCGGASVGPEVKTSYLRITVVPHA